ncbi:MAG: hypothetical protein NTW21_31735 [Verrucomicrobia bacterium]|nr:hypothetical protein [Verrucomicrobiota bacterium]
MIHFPYATAIHERHTYRMHDLGEFMKTLLARFTRWCNTHHARTGTRWESRFKSVLVEDGIASRTISAYIDLNSVRAGMVTDPADYRWSSYGEAMGGVPEAMARRPGRAWCGRSWHTRDMRRTRGIGQATCPKTHSSYESLEFNMSSILQGGAFSSLKGRVTPHATPGACRVLVLERNLETAAFAGTDNFRRTKGYRVKGKNQRFRRVTNTPLTSNVRTSQLGSGTLATRKPKSASSYDGSWLQRDEGASVEGVVGTGAPAQPCDEPDPAAMFHSHTFPP